MRAVVQRVAHASVTVDSRGVASIGAGLLVLVGVGHGDTDADANYLAAKVRGLRVFEDEHGKMNLDVGDVGGSVLAVSQFTLFGDCRKGRRPSFVAAMEPDAAATVFEKFVQELRALGVEVGTGVFGADMKVELLNDGPVTLLIDSRKEF